MSNERTTLSLARWLRGCKLPYDPQDVSDCADELERLAAVEIEHGNLLAKVADLTLSLGASDRRFENHTSFINGYQNELTSLRSELEAARGRVWNAPPGWKLVPVEPTPEMGWAYLDAARLHSASSADDTMRFSWGGYRAMLKAAPQP